MKAVVFTLGCKVNTYESELLMTGLKDLGWEVSSELGFADLYILNTCAVTKEAEKKSRQAVARVKKFNKSARIIVTGCASELNAESFYKKENVELVTGAKSKEKILKILNQTGIKKEEKDEYLPCDILPLVENSRVYVKVQDGCNNFCSYCIIPYLRGRSRSRDLEEILSEIDKIDASEIVITGINLSAYNFNGKTLSDLIKSLAYVDKRIRLGSLEVRVINRELLENLKNLKRFSPQFHLSLQSGSDIVLKSMNRHYTTGEYLEKVNLIREYFPYASITTDVIVGYPTETEEEFLKSLDFCKKVGFSDIHCFPYSPREGTAGYKLTDLSPSVKKERMDKILELKSSLIKGYFEKVKDIPQAFIPEEFDGQYTLGTTDTYVKCKVFGKIDSEKIITLDEFGQVCLANIKGE